MGKKDFTARMAHEAGITHQQAQKLIPSFSIRSRAPSKPGGK